MRSPVPPPFDDSLLSAHAAGLRALALSILRDREAAEDVVQETWARALVAPPADRSGLGGWLRVVARGLALNRLRDERRRRERETAAVRARGANEAEEDDLRAEGLRAVVDAVLALDEPYRRVVLARYFDGHEPAEIAARLGVPVATVATRLKRARERLRERLGPRFGPGSAALALVAGLDPRTVGGAGPTASFPTQAALASCAVIALAAAVFFVLPTANDAVDEPGSGEAAFVGRDRSEARRDVAPATQRGGADSRPDSTGEEAAPGGTARSSLASATERKPPSRVRRSPSEPKLEAGPYVFHLVVEAVDDFTLPCSEATVLASVGGGTLNELGRTDDSGTLDRTWRGFEPVQELELLVRHPAEGCSPLVRVELAHDATTTARLPLRIARRAAEEEDEEAVVDFERLREGKLERRDRARSKRTESADGFGLDGAGEAPRFALDARGNGVFTEPMLLSVPGVTRPVSPAVRERASTRPTSKSRRGGGQVEFALEVRDARGRPARSAVAVLVLEASGTRLVLTTDDEGRASTRLSRPGRARLAILSPLAKTHVEELEIPPLGARFERELEEGEPLSVRITDAGGAALEGVAVEAWSGASFAGSARTAVDGRATLRLAKGGPWRLLARIDEAPVEIAELLHSAVWCGSSEHTFALRSEPTREASFAVRFAPTRGAELADACARLWDPQTEQGLILPRLPSAPLSGVPFLLQGTRNGVFVLAAGGTGEDWSSFGEVRLPARGMLDLGVVPFRENGTIVLDSGRLSAGARVSVDVGVVRDGARLTLPAFEVELPTKLAAAPGAWTVTVRFTPPEAVEPAATSAPSSASNASTDVDVFRFELERGGLERLEVASTPPSAEPTSPAVDRERATGAPRGTGAELPRR